MKKLALLFAFIVLSGCSAVTVRTDGLPESSETPAFEQRYTYWWWGLKGEHSVNVREVCAGKNVEQVQAIYSLVDIISGVFTLGIYAPRTAKIWCEEMQS